MKNYSERAEFLASEIRSLAPQLEKLSLMFRMDPNTGKEPLFDKYSSDDWRRNTYGNALVKIRQIIENNFQYIEQMSLLVVSRYIFELSIWLLLFEKDSRYGLVYYWEFLCAQKRFFEDSYNQLVREVVLLKLFEQLDSQAKDQLITEIDPTKLASEFIEMLANATDHIDSKAARNFMLYLDDAKMNGYGFQAHLVENNAMPMLAGNSDQIAAEIQQYEIIVPPEVKALARGGGNGNKKWNWSDMAKMAGIAEEYDYIYSYASKFLHATPMSLTTDYKNLELPEMCVFLSYIYVKMQNIIELAEKQPECVKSLSCKKG